MLAPAVGALPSYHSDSALRPLLYPLSMLKRSLLASVALCAISFSVVDGFKAVCKPLSQGTCLACSNCQYCVYCSQQGGQCSVCAKARRR